MSASTSPTAPAPNTQRAIRSIKPNFHLTDSTAMERPLGPIPAASPDTVMPRNKPSRPRAVEAIPDAAIPASADVFPTGSIDEGDSSTFRLAVGAESRALAKAKDTDARSQSAYLRESKLERKREAAVEKAKQEAPDAMDVDDWGDRMDVDVDVDEDAIRASIQPFFAARATHPDVADAMEWVDRLMVQVEAREQEISEELERMRAQSQGQGKKSAKAVREKRAQLYAALDAKRDDALDMFGVLAACYFPVGLIVDHVELELDAEHDPELGSEEDPEQDSE